MPIDIQASDLCGRFAGRIIKNINPKAQTPDWMLRRLARCGQRSVSPLVDISNYVMFEWGRPSHMFDLAKIQGGLQVRWGVAGETLELLNGQKVTVDESVGVIADAVGLESLAGVMGGAPTAVSDTTQDVFVEAAFWWPHAIAGRSRRFGFSTDAAHRFERGVDPESLVEHLEHITAWVLSICGGEAGPLVDQMVSQPKRQPITVRMARVVKILGMPVTLAQCEMALSRLGLSVQTHEATQTIQVLPPSYRFDLNIEEDIVEEIIRIIGFDQLPHTPPLAPIQPRPEPESVRSANMVRQILVNLGYFETISYSFVKEHWETEWLQHANPIRLLNPIASHMSVMRSSLMPSLVACLAHNLSRQTGGHGCLRLFEMGRVFRFDAAIPHGDTTVAGYDQPMRLAGLAYGLVNEMQWGQTDRNVDFYDVKHDLEALFTPHPLETLPAVHPLLHPGRCATIKVRGEVVGWLGELHPQWTQQMALPHAPVLFEVDVEAVLARTLPQITSLSSLPSIVRDIAVVVTKNVTYSTIQTCLNEQIAQQALLQSACLFDVYQPSTKEGGGVGGGGGGGGLTSDEKSLAIRLNLQPETSHVTESDIETVVQKVLSALMQSVGAKLRHG